MADNGDNAGKPNKGTDPKPNKENEEKPDDQVVPVVASGSNGKAPARNATRRFSARKPPRPPLRPLPVPPHRPIFRPYGPRGTTVLRSTAGSTKRVAARARLAPGDPMGPPKEVGSARQELPPRAPAFSLLPLSKRILHSQRIMARSSAKISNGVGGASGSSTVEEQKKVTDDDDDDDDDDEKDKDKAKDNNVEEVDDPLNKAKRGGSPPNPRSKL
ncbi:hypothetical protein ACFE04_010355 [Oxalis oulophora]